MSRTRSESSPRVGWAAVAALLATTIPACHSWEKSAQPAQKSGGHDIHSTTLEDLMAELHRQTVDRLSEDLEAAQNQADHFRDVADAALALERSARQLRDHVPGYKWDGIEQRRFMMLADRMADDANNLHKYALSARPTTEVAESYYDKILISCNECHSTFRVLPKLPAQRQASR